MLWFGVLSQVGGELGARPFFYGANMSVALAMPALLNSVRMTCSLRPSL